jgi:UDP-N-acetylmuramate dehydrogenase
MKIREHVSLKRHNTFGIETFAERFVTVHSRRALHDALALGIRPIHLLGGGSNILLTRDLDGLTIKNAIHGIRIVQETEHDVWVAAAGGENWHSFVLHCLQQGWGGIENLSLIPGSVGATPIQNIGAYGVEIKDVFQWLEAIEIETGKAVFFSHADCRFGYRDSLFKQEGKGKYVIVEVVFRLSKRPVVNISYGDIRAVLDRKGIENPGIRDVSDAVIEIRRSKLPDPAVLGNAGSFFKNPEIDTAEYQRLVTKFPQVPHYELPGGKVKIPAGWLIEQCGWKGRRIAEAGCHERQALVLVNFGKATGQDLLSLSKNIQADVEAKFGIRLTPEVNVW